MSLKNTFKRIIVSLDNLPDDALEELRKQFHLIEEKDPYAIWKKWRYKKNNGDGNAFSIQNVFALETFLFVNYLKRHGATEIEIFNNQELFIFNEGLYRIKDNKVVEENIENTGFFGVRPGNWHYPFFLILGDLITAKGGVFNKTNRIKGRLSF